jgi:hypothetical protein
MPNLTSSLFFALAGVSLFPGRVTIVFRPWQSTAEARHSLTYGRTLIHIANAHLHYELSSGVPGTLDGVQVSSSFFRNRWKSQFPLALVRGAPRESILEPYHASEMRPRENAMPCYHWICRRHSYGDRFVSTARAALAEEPPFVVILLNATLRKA